MKKLKHASLLKIMTIAISILFFTTPNYSQVKSIEMGTSSYSLGLNLGLNDFHIKDNYISPDLIRGILFASEISFQAKLNKALHSVDIYYSAGSPGSKSTQVDALQKMGCLSYSYSQVVNSWNNARSNLDFSLGAGISSFVTNTDLIINSQIGGGKYTDQSWYWSHSLNILARGDYSISENQNLSIQFVVPVFKIVSRPNNGHWLDQSNLHVMYDSFFNAASGGRREFLWENFVLQCKINFKQKLDENVILVSMYRFSYISNDSPLSMKSYMNNFLVGLEFSL